MRGGLNFYGYANGKPIQMIDPRGLDAEERPDPTIPLTDCQKEWLSPYFDQKELDNVRVFVGGFVPPGNAAFTPTGTLFNVKPEYYKNPLSTDTIGLVAHEMTHMQQHRADFLMGPKYLGELMSKGSKEGQGNTYEDPAYEMGKKVTRELNGIFPGGTCKCVNKK